MHKLRVIGATVCTSALVVLTFFIPPKKELTPIVFVLIMLLQMSLLGFEDDVSNSDNYNNDDEGDDP